MITRLSPAAKTFLALWTVATAVGFGLGWAFAVELGNPIYIGLTLGVAQAIVLLPKWRHALSWAAITLVGWLVALIAIAVVVGRDRNWFYYVGGLPFVTFLALALVQWAIVSYWFKGRSFILWIGTAVCGFPVAGFLAIVFFLLVDGGSRSFIIELPPVLAPVFWLMGGVYGAFTGLSLAVGAPNLYYGRHLSKRLSFGILGLALAALLAIFMHSALNTLDGYDLLVGDDVVGLYALRVLVYVALGFSIGRLRGVVTAISVALLVAATDVIADVAARVTMERFSGAGSLFPGSVPDFATNTALPVAS